MTPEHVLIKKLICENVLRIETPVPFFERHPKEVLCFTCTFSEATMVILFNRLQEGDSFS